MSVPTKGAGLSGGPSEIVLHLDTCDGSGGTHNLVGHVPEVGNGYVQGVLGSGTYVVTTGNNVIDLPDTINHRLAWTIPDSVPRQIKIDWRQPGIFDPMGILFRVSDETHYWKVKSLPLTNDMWLMYADGGGENIVDSDMNVVHTSLTWYTYWVDLSGNDIEVYFATQGAGKPGSPIMSFSSSILVANKGIGFYADDDFQRFDNVKAWSYLAE